MIRKIVVIGNSHAHSFTGSRLSNFGRGDKSTKFLSSYSLGPLSAKSIANSKWNLVEKFLNPMEEPSSILVILSLGENDCRWYIPEQADRRSGKFDFDSAVKISNTFLSDLYDVMKRIENLGFQVAGWAGHPTPNLPHDEERVIYGPYAYRAKISSYWENEIIKYCNQERFIVLSPMHELLDSSGLPREEYYIDEWHLDPRWLSKFLIESLVNMNAVGRFSLLKFKLQVRGQLIFRVFQKVYLSLRS